MSDGGTKGAQRRPLIGTSWKMHLVPSAAAAYLETLVPLVSDIVDRDLFVLPPFPALPIARERLLGTNVAFGAQDVHPEDEGPYTGDVSAPMLADLGCRFVEVGHAERRRDHGETPPLVAAKVRAVLRWRMEPIVCIGEARRQHPDAVADALIAELASLLGGLAADDVARVVIAYEPVWAIGAGAEAASAHEVGRVHAAIRGWLDGLGDGGRRVRVIYGGSVDPQNASALLAQSAVDGLFVGRRALNPDVFAAIAATPVESNES